MRYFLASSATVEAAADADPNLTQVASSGPWSTSYNGEALDTTWKVYQIERLVTGGCRWPTSRWCGAGCPPTRPAG